MTLILRLIDVEPFCMAVMERQEQLSIVAISNAKNWILVIGTTPSVQLTSSHGTARPPSLCSADVISSWCCSLCSLLPCSIQRPGHIRLVKQVLLDSETCYVSVEPRLPSQWQPWGSLLCEVCSPFSQAVFLTCTAWPCTRGSGLFRAARCAWQLPGSAGRKITNGKFLFFQNFMVIWFWTHTFLSYCFWYVYLDKHHRM